MRKLFKNKYRIESTRLKRWDYKNAAAYFITICTKNRLHYFGEILDDEMHLTEIGKQVEIEWIKTLEIRPDMNLELGKFVVMPDHFHAIIGIGENEYNSGGDAIIGIGENEYNSGGDAMHRAFGPQSKNLASIIRGFKSSITKYARINKIDFQWQSGFHDHIIRNEMSYHRISDYITKNPANWNSDKFRIDIKP